VVPALLTIDDGDGSPKDPSVDPTVSVGWLAFICRSLAPWARFLTVTAV
jgi:hypothetical protein